MYLFLQHGANFEETFPERFKRPMTLYVYDIIPMVLLSDGWFTIEAVFTKEAVNFFRKNFSHLKLESMAGKCIKLCKWSF